MQHLKSSIDSNTPDAGKDVALQEDQLNMLVRVMAARLKTESPCAELLSFDSGLDDDEVALCLFHSLDEDKNGLIEKVALQKLQRDSDAEMVLLRALEPEADQLNFMAFQAMVRKVPRVPGQRVAWIRGMRIEADLARHLRPGTLDDGLEGARRMSAMEVDAMLDAFFADTRRKFTAEWERLQTGGCRNAVEANSKFDGFDGTFATLDEFHAGQDLGYPNPDLRKGIRLEHRAHPSSNRLFFASNYQLVTSLSIEYAWAVLEDEPSALDEARKQLERLREARADKRKARASSADGLFFPGEVGDSCVDSIIMLSWQALESHRQDVEDLEAAALKGIETAGMSVLENEEEIARGVQTLSRAACAEWLTKSSAVLRGAVSPVAGVRPQGGDFVVGLVLPMCRDRAETKLEAISKALTDQMGSVLVGASVDVRFMACKVWTYCAHTGIEGMMSSLRDMGLDELRQLCAETTLATREQLISSALNTFVVDDLQADFRAALEHASDSQLASLLQTWGVSGESRAEQVDCAARALNSVQRWRQVEVWVGQYRGRIQGRRRLGIRKLMKRERDKVQRNQLKLEEVLAMYLYTGPEFIPMNSVCRNHPPNIIHLLRGDGSAHEGNKLCTTLFCVSSGLKKLGRSTEVPETRTVYRGLGKMRLPKEFWMASGTPPWRGGVERAFMSTTADKSVALFYANGKGTVVEISVGRVQIGGDVSFLSMVAFQTHLTFRSIGFVCALHIALFAARTSSAVTLVHMAVSVRKGDHVPAFHCARVQRRAPRGTHRQGRGGHLSPSGSSTLASSYRPPKSLQPQER